MKSFNRSLLFILLLFASFGALQATPIVYNGSSGDLSASASFDLSGSILKIVLANTSNADVLVPENVLTGLFFNTSNSLAPIAASLNGSSVFYKSTNDPGKGWGYADGVNAQGMNSAISASGAVSGLGHSNFSGTVQSLGGLNYGILSMGDDPLTGNKGVTGKGPLFNNSLEFSLLASDGFSLDDIGNKVVFQYGTSLSEIAYEGYIPDSPAVPEPGTILLLSSGLAALAITKRRKIRSCFRERK